MKLIIGLGNPGTQYQNTWHNAGFLAIDEIKNNDQVGFSEFKNNKKMRAEITEKNDITGKIILAKPQTFMNNSGQSVKTLMNFYKIKLSDVWIIHDDIDLPLGKIRISKNASAGGHKGIQSIIDELASQEFIRFRIGIASEKQRLVPTESYVLQKIDKEDKIIINESIKKILSAIELGLMEEIEQVMNQFN